MKNHNLNLIWTIAKTDFSLRYYGSVLGYIWALFKPFLLFLVLWVVFSVFMQWEIPNFQIYLLLGIILWNFFVESTTLGLKALVTKSGIIKKIYFPRIFIVISSTLTAFLGLALNLLVVFLFCLIFGVTLKATVLALFLYISIFYVLILGLSLLLSALFLKLKDIDQIWEVALSAFFWLIPIVYAKEMIPAKYQFLVDYNPLAIMIDICRRAVLNGTLATFNEILYVSLISFTIFAIGYYIFLKLSPLAAEEL